MFLSTLTFTEEQFTEFKIKSPNMGKNCDIGRLALEVVKVYFTSIDSEAKFENPKNGGDLKVTYCGKTEHFEVKGTAKSEIEWSSLRVSSQQCHDALVAGMPIIRVTNVVALNPSLLLLNLRSILRW